MLRPILRVSRETSFDFIRWRFIAGGISLLLVLVSLGTIAVSGFKLGIDFSGGTLIEVRTNEKVAFDDLRATLSQSISGDLSLQGAGEENDILIRVQDAPEGETPAIDAVKAALGPDVEIRRIESIGPQVTSELMFNAVMALLAAGVLIALYIAFRFEWQYSVGAIIALVHDIVLILGIYAVFRIEFDLTSVAAVLTVAGYSINDTVVIFDRVRELTRKYKALDYKELVNLATNQTLMRTLATSGSTLVAILPLLIWGGDVLFGLSLALFIGIIVGTYSTVYIASATLIYLTPRGRAQQAATA